jgi:hypothetical protein
VIPPDRDEYEGWNDGRDTMTDPELAEPGAVTGAPPDQKSRPDEREGDDSVERPTPRRQVRPCTRDEKKGNRDDELNERERDEDQEATPAALFI